MKLNILCVDDEANVIRGLKRMLRVLKEDWEFYFAESGKEALKIMEQTNIDVIISDMRMPEMNGAELLEIVKEKYPASIRIILSGQSNEKLSLKSTRSVHKFISKPVEAEKLKETIQQLFKLHQFLDNDELRKTINGINRLPSLPQTYMKIEEELGKENFSLQKITDIISNDVIMSAKILQVINSAFFGLSRNISNLGHAVNLIGANTIQSLILSVQIFKTCEGSDEIEKHFNDIWEHSLKVAHSAKKIVSTLGINPKDSETAYIAGLLHDIGKVVILNTEEYRNNIFNFMEENNVTYNQAEQEVLSSSHAEVGGYLLRLWDLPEEVAEAVSHHHSSTSINVENIDVTSAVFFANLFVENREISPEDINNYGFESKLIKIIDFCTS